MPEVWKQKQKVSVKLDVLLNLDSFLQDDQMNREHFTVTKEKYSSPALKCIQVLASNVLKVPKVKQLIIQNKISALN